MPALAMMLIPMIPGLVNSVMSIIDTISNHDGTPTELKAQLDSISADLKALVEKVQAVQLPD
jgi:peptidoglycan hydrolase CwlO-like protein